jgi:hypothetical protein
MWPPTMRSIQAKDKVLAASRGRGTPSTAKGTVSGWVAYGEMMMGLTSPKEYPQGEIELALR